MGRWRFFNRESKSNFSYYLEIAKSILSVSKPSAVRNLENQTDLLDYSASASRYASYAEDFITNEDITSIYYMNTFRGEVATIILGFRYEITETETFGNDASLNEDGVGGYECAGSFADDVCVISQSSSSKHEFCSKFYLQTTT